MQSIATTVDAYLAEVPPERRDMLVAIRGLCLANLPGCMESMTYGLPSYAKDGVVEVGFASQKNSISIYGLKSDVLQAHRAAKRSAKIGKGCIRYTMPLRVDLAAV